MSLRDLAYVRRRLPQYTVFYDLPRPDHVQFSLVKDSPVTDSGGRDVVSADERRAFNADQWKVCSSIDFVMVPQHILCEFIWIRRTCDCV